jgi:hypothetical protein
VIVTFVPVVPDVGAKLAIAGWGVLPPLPPSSFLQELKIVKIEIPSMRIFELTFVFSDMCLYLVFDS